MQYTARLAQIRSPVNTEGEEGEKEQNLLQSHVLIHKIEEAKIVAIREREGSFLEKNLCSRLVHYTFCLCRIKSRKRDKGTGVWNSLSPFFGVNLQQ
jgi:hypothetical protein